MVQYTQKNKKKLTKKQSFKKKRHGGAMKEDTKKDDSIKDDSIKDDSVEDDSVEDDSGKEDVVADAIQEDPKTSEYDSWVQSLVDANDQTTVKNALKVMYIDKHSIESIVTNLGENDAFDKEYKVGLHTTDETSPTPSPSTPSDNVDSLNKITQEGGKSINGTNACWINAPVYAFAAHPSILSLVETHGGELGAKVSAMSKDVGLWNDDSYEALRAMMSASSPKLPDTLGEYDDAHLPMLALLRASSSEPLDVKDDDFGAPPLTDSVPTSALKLVSSTSFPLVSSDQKLVSIVVSACMDLDQADAGHFVVHVLDGDTGLYHEFDALQGGLLEEGRDYKSLQEVLSDCADEKGRHYLSLYA